MRIPARSALLSLAWLALLSLPRPAAGAPDAPHQSPPVQAFSFDREHAALLVMDFENDILAMLPEKAQGPLLDRASAILKEARAARLPIIYVVVRFRDGYPELSPQNKRFSALKASGRLREGSPGAEIHGRVAPQAGDIVFTKRRVGAFSTTDLESILRANHITTLAMIGISTSGVVLSTVRWASDLDYQLLVVGDACADFDDEVHRVLMEKVFPGQATVLTTEAFLQALEAKAK